MNFSELNLKQELQKAINKCGYKTTTEIQQKAIPIAIDKKDIIGKSHTGTGKTAAFVLPILNAIDVNFKKVQSVILCPTRELANQVLDQVRKYSFYLEGVNAVLLCGGSQIQLQIYGLKRCNIVVGTPGRIADHINRGTLKLNHIKTIVLDEADEMLKMGFKEDINKVFKNTTSNYQTLLFSATMPKAVLEIANTYQKDPVHITASRSETEQNNITQYYVDTRGNTKEEILVELFKNISPKLSIIFSNTKSYTDKIANLLENIGIESAVINGDKRQSERLRAMNAFRSNRVNVLIATDVASRGIDVDGVDYVFNYDLPKEKENYTHRIGRTARNGAKGTAITLISNRMQLGELKDLERYQNKTIDLYDISDYDLRQNLPPLKLNEKRKDQSRWANINNGGNGNRRNGDWGKNKSSYNNNNAWQGFSKQSGEKEGRRKNNNFKKSYKSRAYA